MATDRRSIAPKDSFHDLVIALQLSTRWSHAETARRLGVSGKTLTRYMTTRVPKGARRRDMVRALDGVDPALQARLAALLEVEHTPVMAKSAARPGTADAVTMAIYKAAEEHDLTPAKARAVVRAFLNMMVEHGVDASTARAALPVKSPAR
jgi:hypothetical protein